MSKEVSLEFVKDISDPFEDGLYPITPREIEKAIKFNNIIHPKNDGYICRADYIGRIAWFVVNGFEDPIEIDMENNVIADGNKRLASQMFLNKETIKVKTIDLCEV
jgi:hypothetical protein